MDKSGHRARFKGQVAQLSKESLKEQSRRLVDRLWRFLQSQSGFWGIYCPLRDEPDLRDLLHISSKIQWAFPVVLGPTQMEFRLFQGEDQLVASSWGLCEPNDKAPKVEGDQMQGLLVPGLAFDRFGYRLGRGGGFYDRFLQDFKGLKLGVTFQEALSLEALPSEPHDQKMDFVVSPNEWIAIKKSEVIYGV